MMTKIPTWKAGLIIFTSLLGFIFALPNVVSDKFKGFLPDWLANKTVVLGLDLQGGSHLLLEVDLKTVAQDLLTNTLDSVREILRKERIGYVGLEAQGSSIHFQVRASQEVEKAMLLLKADPQWNVERQGERGVIVRISPEGIAQRNKSAVDQSLEIVRRRIDAMGTKEPVIQRQGEDRIIVQLPGVNDPEEVKKLLGQTAKMTFRLVDVEASVEEALRGRIPGDAELLEGEEKQANPDAQKTYYVIKKKVMVSGENLTDAYPSMDHQYNRPVVGFKFDSLGARKFGEVTRENIGKPFAIVLDNKVISAPRIMSAITGGQGQIEGGFTVKEAHELALLLRAGALPAPLTVLEQRTVGPDLGADSIKAGQRATIFSVVLVCIFMIIAYMFFGLIANVALMVNLVWLFGALSILQATLTLPGIAGIALTLGMAVDANVLIYERIKEEIRNGLKPLSAIEAGYKRAMNTVIDSNLTTLLGAAVLYEFGTGPVKGFAVTLALGIIISMFTAISLTRLITLYWYHWRRPKVLPI